MNIFLSGTEDHFIRCLEVLWSLRLHVKGHIRAWILSDGKAGIDTHLTGSDIDLQIIDAADVDLDKSKLIPVSQKVLTKMAYGRLFMPQILPADVSRCLYLDSDTIVCKDKIQDFYDTQFDGYAACCRDRSIELFAPQELARTQVSKYFNSGVMVMDMDKIRKDSLDKTFLDLFFDPPEWLAKDGCYCDQTILNYAFKEQVKFMDPCYNVQSIMFGYPQYTDYIKEFGYDSQESLVKQAVISHAQGSAKPWNFEQFLHWQQWQLGYRIWQFDVWNFTRKSLLQAYPYLKHYYS